MNQIVQTIGENASYIGAAVGYTAGLVAESRAAAQVAANEQQLAAVWGAEVVGQSTHQASRLRRLGVAAVSALALGGGIAGALNGEAWATQTEQAAPPFVGVVVDRSGATAFSGPDANAQAPNQQIDRIAGIFTEEDGIKTEGFVAVAGEVRPTRVDQLNSVSPSGDAPIGQALTVAMGRIGEQRAKAGAIAPKSAIVVTTNGNTLGDPATIAAAAKANNTPVYVVNVEGASDPTAVTQLQEVAKQTGGQYWDVNSQNTDKMRGTIQKKLEDSEVFDTGNSRSSWPKRVAYAAASAAFLGVGYQGRRKMTLRHTSTSRKAQG